MERKREVIEGTVWAYGVFSLLLYLRISWQWFTTWTWIVFLPLFLIIIRGLYSATTVDWRSNTRIAVGVMVGRWMVIAQQFQSLFWLLCYLKLEGFIDWKWSVVCVPLWLCLALCSVLYDTDYLPKFPVHSHQSKINWKESVMVLQEFIV